jgi:hypothetical protein
MLGRRKSGCSIRHPIHKEKDMGGHSENVMRGSLLIRQMLGHAEMGFDSSSLSADDYRINANYTMEPTYKKIQPRANPPKADSNWPKISIPALN